MALVNLEDMLLHAYQHHYAIGSFEIVDLQFLQAIIDSAENFQSPVILSISESYFNYFDFELIMPAIEAAAKRASVPVAIHLNHGHSLQSAIRAIRHGCNSIMMKESQNSRKDTFEVTKKVVDMAHACGIPVEGEINIHSPSDESDLKDATNYVGETGVDSVEISIGTVKNAASGESVIANFNRALGIPLAIQDPGDLDDVDYTEFLSNGVAKIHFRQILINAAINQTTSQVHSHDELMQLAVVKRQAISLAVDKCIALCGSVNRARDVLAHAAPWRAVEHLIIYNVSGLSDLDTDNMIQSGHQCLTQIPGVRQVISGEAVISDASYRFCWLIRFCHPRVIESYKHHPIHMDYADHQFRPHADKRLSIDYLLKNG